MDIITSLWTSAADIMAAAAHSPYVLAAVVITGAVAVWLTRRYS